jgi:hypothetical protein
MGGSGSGRWGSRKPTAEHMARIDLATIRRQYPVTRLSKLTSSYTRQNGQRVTADIYFDHTTTRFGGSRLWFVCPACRQRCRVLFGSWRIACRRCHRLRYGSQVESRSSRAIRGMTRIVKRLDPEATCNDLPSKPKGMHWKTYNRLADRYDEYDNRWAIGVMRRLRIRLG